MKTLGLTVALFAALVLAPRTCAAQSLKYERLSSLAGVTICYKEQGYSFVSTGLSEIEEADTKAHEAKHREQYTRFKTCDDFGKWYNTPGGKMEAEAEAYHAGWCVSIGLGADSASFRNSYVERIEHELGGEINRLSVLQAFLRYDPCPK